MGQSTSAAGNSILHPRRTKSFSLKFPIQSIESEISQPDYTSYLPDKCLALVFQFLNSGNRKRCALVCRRWMIVEGQNRYRLSLHARSDLITSIPSLFSRFDSVTKLSLKCDRRSVSIGDEALIRISLRCRSLKRLKLRACRELTDVGMAAFAENCKDLKIFSCGSCDFGAKGVKAVLDHCSNLEELSIKRLCGFTDIAPELIGPGVAASSLKSICLKELYNGQCFGPVIVGAKNLRSLKLFRCSGDWDLLLQEMAVKDHGIVEIHLERMQVSDVALSAISNCSSLEILHLVKTPECTNFGLAAIAEKCKHLRKLHIDGWKANLIGDEGLVAVARFCSQLQELVLIGVNPTTLSLEMLAAKCQNLERLALCGCETFGDPELSCIAAKCPALRKLCIKNCPISDVGIENLANGCPCLTKVKINKCRGVMGGCADWLRTVRPMLSVNADTVEPEHQDEASNDAVVGLQEDGIEFPHLNSQIMAPSIASGYLRMERNIKATSGKCGIAVEPSYPIKNGENPPNPGPSPPSPIKPPTQCDSYYTCAESNTCCCLFEYGRYCFAWGCCPLEAATCCDDNSSCCPHEYPVCDLEQGTCLLSKNSPFSVKALKRKPATPFWSQSRKNIV